MYFEISRMQCVQIRLDYIVLNNGYTQCPVHLVQSQTNLYVCIQGILYSGHISEETGIENEPRHLLTTHLAIRPHQIIIHGDNGSHEVCREMNSPLMVSRLVVVVTIDGPRPWRTPSLSP